MIGTTTRQTELFFESFLRQTSLHKDDLLDTIDELLDDDELVDLVRSRLAKRRPGSARTGRPSIAPDRLLRCCVLKHLKGWSFRELERELCCNLHYRHFTRFDADKTPSFSTLSRSFALLDAEVNERIHRRVLAIAKQTGVAKGRKMRTDTTVVETNIHPPSDSSLLGDGIRVLTRTLKRLAKQCEPGAIAVVDHARAVKRRLLEISRAAKRLTENNRERMKQSYRKLLALSREVTRAASKALSGLESGELAVSGNPILVMEQAGILEEYLPLHERVIAQTQERVFRGNRHVANKVLSLFEPHTVVVRKGKAHKPTEFGRLVRLDEVENGIVSSFEVCQGNPADTNAIEPALCQHMEIFGRAPAMATADRGCFSAANELLAKAKGVVRVALPARGRLSETRAKRQKQRWFRRAMRWRAGIEARIATLKGRFSMLRATYKGEHGFERYVAWCVITHNLVSIARTQRRRSLVKARR